MTPAPTPLRADGPLPLRLGHVALICEHSITLPLLEPFDEPTTPTGLTREPLGAAAFLGATQLPLQCSPAVALGVQAEPL